MRKQVKRLLSVAADNTAFHKAISLLEQATSERPNLLRVLTYHRVDEPDVTPTLYPRVTVRPEAFKQQMGYLAANYCPISMAELLDVCQTGKSLPPRSVLVTFDDAYCDFVEHAWPTMKGYRIPVTLFVPTAFPDHPERSFWWDQLYHALQCTALQEALHSPLGHLPLATTAQREQVFSQLRDYIKTLPHSQAMIKVEQICKELDVLPPPSTVLSWEALRRLASQGVTLAAHTRTHPLMNRISLKEARDEAVGSLCDLEREIGPTPPVFAYPSGGFDDEVVNLLRREGFILAFTTIRGINNLQQADPLLLKRINVGPGTTSAIFRVQLLSWPVYRQ